MEYQITGIERLRKGAKVFIPIDRDKLPRVEVNEDFLEKVQAVLPPQPWKPGIHKEAVKQLNCTLKKLSSAINILIEREVFLRQKDGVLYNLVGDVVGIDRDRVDPETLKLLSSDDLI